jgi:protocatechuate 3,4-dioxygenase beta subunit
MVGFSDGDMESETGKDGRFRIEGALTNARYGLEARGSGGARAKVEDVVFEEGMNEVDVVLRLDDVGAPGRVEGRIVDESARGVAAALVKLGGREVSTDGDGRFALDGVPSGPRRARYAGIGYALAFSPPFDVAAGKTTRAPDWVLPRTGLVIQGRVADATGRPIEDADVVTAFVLPAGDFLLVGTCSGRNGLYRVEGPAMPSAEVNLNVSAPGFMGMHRTAKPDPVATVDVTLAVEAGVSGRISFLGPTPESVRIWYAGDTTYLQPANVQWDAATGAVRMDRIAPGRYRFYAIAPGYAPGGFQDLRSASMRPRPPRRSC